MIFMYNISIPICDKIHNCKTVTILYNIYTKRKRMRANEYKVYEIR